VLSNVAALEGVLFTLFPSAIIASSVSIIVAIAPAPDYFYPDHVNTHSIASNDNLWLRLRCLPSQLLKSTPYSNEGQKA
jgi:hypothetical protein